ncbi:MAG: hypothetical protein KDA29_05400 [Phycisphaerales bacterium]|nr:hypothetical protein [Phycisphaerales bacterium]
MTSARCCVYLTFAITTTYTTSLLSASDIVVDLNGGYLFGYDTPPTEPMTFSYSTNSGENHLITNGYFKGGVNGWWTDFTQYRVTVAENSTLEFGTDFPLDSNFFANDQWRFNVNGELIAANGRSIRVQRGPNNDYEDIFTISSSGALHVENGTSMWIPGGTNNGTINILQGSSVICEEATLYSNGDGIINIGRDSKYRGAIFDQTVYLASNAELEGEFPDGCTIYLPEDGPAEFSVYSSGVGWGRMIDCQIIINSVPDPANVSHFGNSDGFIFWLNSEIILLDASAKSIGEVNQILSVSSCSNCDEEVSWSTNQLVPPAPTNDRHFIMRWSKNGLYCITTPLDWCEADLNFDGVLDFFDVSVFINGYLKDSPLINLHNDMDIDFFDVSAFLNAYTNGCN